MEVLTCECNGWRFGGGWCLPMVEVSQTVLHFGNRRETVSEHHLGDIGK